MLHHFHVHNISSHNSGEFRFRVEWERKIKVKSLVGKCLSTLPQHFQFSTSKKAFSRAKTFLCSWSKPKSQLFGKSVWCCCRRAASQEVEKKGKTFTEHKHASVVPHAHSFKSNNIPSAQSTTENEKLHKMLHTSQLFLYVIGGNLCSLTFYSARQAPRLDRKVFPLSIGHQWL